jgi:hypothetical protein
MHLWLFINHNKQSEVHLLDFLYKIMYHNLWIFDNYCEVILLFGFPALFTITEMVKSNKETFICDYKIKWLKKLFSPFSEIGSLL